MLLSKILVSDEMLHVSLDGIAGKLNAWAVTGMLLLADIPFALCNSDQ